MPNWCSNTLVITGPEEDVKAIREHLAQDYTATTNRGGQPDTYTITGPLNLIQMAKPWTNDQEEYDYHNTDKWWDLSIEHWGTKWPVDAEIDETNTDSTKITYEFDSAWAPPLAAIQTCSKSWPTLTFRINFDEPGMDFAGIYEFVQGECTKNIDGESRYYNCTICEESTYCDWGQDLACQYASCDDPSKPTLMHAINEKDPATILWALNGYIENISIGTEALHPYMITEIAERITESPIVGKPAQRRELLALAETEKIDLPDWASHCILAGLTPEQIEKVTESGDHSQEIAAKAVRYALTGSN